MNDLQSNHFTSLPVLDGERNQGPCFSVDRANEPRVSARIKLILTNMQDFWAACTNGDFPAGLDGFMDIDWQGRTVVIRGDVDLLAEVVAHFQACGVLGMR